VFSEQQTKTDNTCFTTNGDAIDCPVMNSDASSLGEKSKRTVTVGFDKIADAQRVAENRFEFFSSHGESTIHAADLGDLVLPGDDIRTLFALPQDNNDEGVWWLNMNSPTVEEIRIICKAFGVHPLTIEDIATHEAREKIELFSSYYFACFRSFRVEEHESGPDYEGFNIYVIVFREGTLSFSFSPNNHAANVRKRLAMLKDYVSLSSDWLCYAMV
jgi:magnesium transporter